MITWKSVQFGADPCFTHTSVHVYLQGSDQCSTNVGLELEAVQLHQWESLLRTIIIFLLLYVWISLYIVSIWKTCVSSSQLRGIKKDCGASFIQYLITTLCVFQWFRMSKQRCNIACLLCLKVLSGKKKNQLFFFIIFNNRYPPLFTKK